MYTILDSGASLLVDSVDVTLPILIMGIFLATVVGRKMLGSSGGLVPQAAWLGFGRAISSLAGRPATDDEQHRDALGQLQRRLPASVLAGRQLEPAVVDLLSQIVDLNDTLHARLASAEGTLEHQAAEITAYKSEARTDAVTGLANRRVFDELLNDRIARWHRHADPVSVLLIDIDHFKRFNDDHGHLAGDEVLTQVARVLRDSMSEGDLVSRIGGEEFAVILAGDCPQSGQTRAEHARREIQRAEFVYENQHLHVTVSIGVADSREAEGAFMLVKRADVALYASKTAGRNIAHWHDGKRAIPISPGRARVNPVSGFAAKGVAELTGTQEFSAVCNELRQRLSAVVEEV